MYSGNPLLRLQASLTPRDQRLLDWLYDHGVLTSAQIARAMFSSLDFAQRRLLRLTQLAVITRFRPQRWHGGSHPYHYVLDQLGYQHVMAQRGEGMPRGDRARVRHQALINRADLAHLLGTNEVFVDLAGYARTHPGTRLARWWPAAAFHEPDIFAHDHQTADAIYRHRYRLPRPDGHGIWIDHDITVPFFLEYDRGTETLAVLVDKVDKYTRLATHTIWRCPVLFHLPNLRREANLQQLLTEDHHTGRAAVATTAADYRAQTGLSPAETIWRPVGDTQRRPLTEIPFADRQTTADAIRERTRVTVL